MEEKLKKYLEKTFLKDSKVIGIEELVDGNSSHHLNYKVTSSDNIYVARLIKPGDMKTLSYANLPDEFTILKLVEKHKVGPRVFFIDLEGFETPILIEEFIEGLSLDKLDDANPDMLDEVISLLVRTSDIDLSEEDFPFKFTYTTYETNLRSWERRINDISKALGENHAVVSEFKKIISSAAGVLKKKESLLQASPKEFIYNDVHPGNLFWISEENKALFIDWQKVSLGDPAYMLALFVRRFHKIWGMDREEFFDKCVELYQNKKDTKNLKELTEARMLERAVADMTWIVLRKIDENSLEEAGDLNRNKYYSETKELLKKF